MLRDCHVAIPFAVVHNFSYLPYNNKKDIRIYFMAPLYNPPPQILKMSSRSYAWQESSLCLPPI